MSQVSRDRSDVTVRHRPTTCRPRPLRHGAPSVLIGLLGLLCVVVGLVALVALVVAEPWTSLPVVILLFAVVRHAWRSSAR